MKRDKIDKEFGLLVSEVEASAQWPNTLSQIKKQLYKNLNSYTHGGNQITARQIYQMINWFILLIKAKSIPIKPFHASVIFVFHLDSRNCKY